MPLPKYEQIMLPLLNAVADGRDHRLADLVEQMADFFSLSPSDRSERYPSGRVRFESGTAWARTDLVQAHVLEAAGCGTVRITQRGRELLEETPSRIDRVLLSRYPEFRDFLSRSRRQQNSAEPNANAAITPQSRSVGAEASPADEAPEEAIARAVRQIDEALSDELLARVGLTPGSAATSVPSNDGR